MNALYENNGAPETAQMYSNGLVSSSMWSHLVGSRHVFSTKLETYLLDSPLAAVEKRDRQYEKTQI